MSMSSNSPISFASSTSLASRRRVPIKTKIVCTIGPASQSVAGIGSLVESGMNVMRLNFSHGSHEYHSSTVANLRTYLAQRRAAAACEADVPVVAIMLDTKGPEIRTGRIEGGNGITVQAGQEFTFYCGAGEWPTGKMGSQTGVSVSYEGLPRTVSVGGVVMVDDGLLGFRVTEIGDTWVRCVSENTGHMGDLKGVNLPNVKVDLPALTEKDRSDIAWGAKEKIDFVAASFIRKASDVHEMRACLAANGASHVQIIAKIENQEGLDNVDEIIEAADAIMVARGDMGVEVPVECVPRYQKMIIRKANAAGKPVITATQMLESMVNNPRPTRAETTDVANAVHDGSDAVMLSGETAKGAYPARAVATMASICASAEADIKYSELYASKHASSLANLPHTPTYVGENASVSSGLTGAPLSLSKAIASSACKTACEIHAAEIIALTQSGAMARHLANYRPIAPVVAVCSSRSVARQLQIVRGVFPVFLGTNAESECHDMCGETLVRHAMEWSMKNSLAERDDLVVITSGQIEGCSGSTNMMRIQTCIGLADSDATRKAL